MVLNLQSKVRINLPKARQFVGELKKVLPKNCRDFNVCFVNDRLIRRLNGEFRGKSRPTDVLSFPWKGAGTSAARQPRLMRREFGNFLGEVVISAETARRNARSEGHSTEREISRLVLHGVLHLVGFDHEADSGRMTAMELSLRTRLGIDGRLREARKVQGSSSTRP